MKLLRAAILASVALSFPAAAATKPTKPAAAKPASGKPQLGTWGVDLTGRDMTIKPGDDFWKHANGTWDKRTEIAPDRTSVGGFVTLADLSEKRVRAIVEDVAKTGGKASTPAQQIGDMYASWMDEAAIEARGANVITPYLTRIEAISDKAGLLKLFASNDYFAPIGVGILPNPADPTRYIAGVAQSGLGMPNRDYYLKDDAKFVGFRTAYKKYMVDIQTLAGLSDPAGRAERIMALETAIATAHWTPERSRDLMQSLNPMDRAKLATFAPQFDWNNTLATLGLGTLQTVVVQQTTAIEAAGKMLDTVPLSTWKEYLAYHFIRQNASSMPKAFDELNFNFFSKTLRDQPVQRDRWKRGVQLVSAGLGEAIGQVYVERHYPPESSAKMAELIGDLRASLQDRLKNNSWMDEPTRTQALTKLAAFDPMIGYPRKWIDYSSLSVKRDDLLGNTLRARKFQWDLQLSRLPNPVDKSLWSLTPQTVNAYYSPLTNQIVFPAAILQPPFFDPHADPAVNYGAIGAVIGHEMGHGFDDQGRRFDAEGKFRNWWSKDTAAKYQTRADALGKQYDQIEVLPGVKINGKLTMGENIGDLSGIETAYGAWRRYVAKHGEPKAVDGLTGDQRFFMAYAQVWRGKRREGAVREQALTDPHSAEFARVNGVVRNFDPWYKAFAVKPGDRMYLPPAQRVKIW